MGENKDRTVPADARIPQDYVRLALDSVKDGVFIVGAADSVDYVNTSAQKSFNIAPSELPAIDILGIEKKGLALRPILNLVRQNGKKEILIQYSENERRFFMEGIPGPDGADNRIIILARDITEIDRLQSSLEMKNKLEKRYKQELWGLRQSLLRTETVASSKAMQQIMELATQIAKVDSNVLLVGESGVGKGVLAKTIHDLSLRYMGPFIKIDCGSFPESLIEAELFGYVGGSFTGALKEGKAGLLDLANGGTLFLDEIGELSMSMQVKLLQVLQEFQYRRVGGNKNIALDARIITATNRDLRQMIFEGRFRQDLYYRLNVVPITIPPLRERTEDIPELVEHFLVKLKNKYGAEKKISNAVLENFLNYPWPGNIRELENMIERLFVTTKGFMIDTQHLPENIAKREVTSDIKAVASTAETPETSNKDADIVVNAIVPLKKATEKLEAELIRMAYQKYNSTIKVGKALAIHQSTAVRKIQKYLRSDNSRKLSHDKQKGDDCW